MGSPLATLGDPHLGGWPPRHSPSGRVPPTLGTPGSPPLLRDEALGGESTGHTLGGGGARLGSRRHQLGSASGSATDATESRRARSDRQGHGARLGAAFQARVRFRPLAARGGRRDLGRARPAACVSTPPRTPGEDQRLVGRREDKQSDACRGQQACACDTEPATAEPRRLPGITARRSPRPCAESRTPAPPPSSGLGPTPPGAVGGPRPHTSQGLAPGAAGCPAFHPQTWTPSDVSTVSISASAVQVAFLSQGLGNTFFSTVFNLLLFIKRSSPFGGLKQTWTESGKTNSFKIR